jgi:U3 small nucleolar RNA-associated protein 14
MVVEQDFEREKAELVEGSIPKAVDVTLPGWVRAHA